ncbi:hypothetical protein BASA62_005192 [Batrachochytrium salamandrivorans]|nr:hypothetical protein BASA62_005192 [Batrachochytrium salamandrivorans]
MIATLLMRLWLWLASRSSDQEIGDYSDVSMPPIALIALALQSPNSEMQELKLKYESSIKNHLVPALKHPNCNLAELSFLAYGPERKKAAEKGGGYVPQPPRVVRVVARRQGRTMLVWRRFLVQIPKLQRKLLLRRPEQKPKPAKMFVGCPPRRKVLGDAPIPLPVGQGPGCSSPTWGVVRLVRAPKAPLACLCAGLLVIPPQSTRESNQVSRTWGWDSYNSNGCARSNRNKSMKNEEEEEDKKVELPSKRPHVEGDAAAPPPPPPSPTPSLSLKRALPSLPSKVDALKDELKVAKAEVAKWSGKKFNSPPETDMSQTNEALKFYTEQAAAAQTALDKANALLLEGRRGCCWRREAPRQRAKTPARLRGGRSNRYVPPSFNPSQTNPLALVAAPERSISFEDAFKRLNLTLPDDLSKFEPQPVQLPDLHPFKASMLSAKVMGKFADPTQPDFLLTKTFDDERIERVNDNLFRRLVIGDRGELVQEEEVVFNDKHVIMLVGTSGAGKTLYTYKLANKQITFLFVCNRQGNGGSDDMGVIIKEAVAKVENGHKIVADFVEHSMLKALALRMRVYMECINTYGADFRPHHWAMAQLYPKQIFGSDIFKDFQEMAVDIGGIKRQTNFLQPSHRIVIDEAQVVDDKLPNFFPSDKKGELCRSLLSPFIRVLVPLDPKLLICGTGLSAISVYETIASPVKEGVGEALIGISAYFTKDRVLQVLESWGIPRTHAQKWAPIFVGRPRHSAFLATALVKDPAEQETDVELEIKATVSRYASSLRTMKDIDVGNPQRSSSSVGKATLFNAVWDAAFDWVLGKQGFLVEDAVVAVKYGVASLAEIDSKLCCVVREPLLLRAVLTNDPAMAFESYLKASDAEIGYQFEDYLGLRMPQLVEDISKLLNQQPGAVDAKWQFPSFDYTHKLGFRAENGKEAEWLEKALESPTPPATLCFPGTAMGPDLIVCAHDKDKPENRLVVLIQVKSGTASTPDAFRSLELLYCENRNLAPAKDGKAEKVQTVEDPTTDGKEKPKKKFQTTKGLEGSKDVVDRLLEKHSVVRLVIKPQAGSECGSIEGFGNFTNVVLDNRNHSQFPSLKLGLERLKKFKIKSEEEE